MMRRSENCGKMLSPGVRELVEIGLEAEPNYVDLINKLEPGMTKERRKELIKQFRDAVYERRQRGQQTGQRRGLPRR